jgi:hypothetical protein
VNLSANILGIIFGDKLKIFPGRNDKGLNPILDGEQGLETEKLQLSPGDSTP